MVSCARMTALLKCFRENYKISPRVRKSKLAYMVKYISLLLTLGVSCVQKVSIIWCARNVPGTNTCLRI